MFTVIICDKEVIHDCKIKYQIHFRPLLDNKEIAFCSWYPEAATLDEALPELNELIKTKKDWRAVIINDRHVISEQLMNKPNPFDFVGTEKTPSALSNKDEVLNYREYVKRTSKKAMENPLMRLTVWLNGYISKLRPEVVAEDEIKKTVPFSDEYLQILNRENVSVIDFETSLARAERFDTVGSKFLIDGELFSPPKSVIAISERAIDISLIEAEAAWCDYSEYDYSKYAEDNLYSSKTRFLVYQIPRIKGVIRELDYFKFLSTVLIFSENDVSYDMFKPGRVYALSSEIDDEKVKKLCNDYVYKLKRTINKIALLRNHRKKMASKPLEDGLVRQEFESDITVPVKLPDEYGKESLLCEYSGIGLSKDCPSDEDKYWESQHGEIRKHFIRFLRQPHRSVKNAVENDFRDKKAIDDLRAKQLSEFQIEDVKYRLQEEEQAMIETSTSKIFNTKEYNERLDEAAKNVKQGISERMTRKKTVYLGIILLALSIFGFLPLLVSEFNNLGTGAFSTVLIAITLGIICVGMIVCLIVLRSNLVEKFRHFNNVMDGIYNEIMGSMNTFSDYLSHACNVMREFSILDTINNKVDVHNNIYKNHEIEIKHCLTDIIGLFPEYIDENYVPEDNIEPYMFDFDKPCSYTYDFPYSSVENNIEYLRSGMRIGVPVDYIKCIKVKREELYD